MDSTKNLLFFFFVVFSIVFLFLLVFAAKTLSVSAALPARAATAEAARGDVGRAPSAKPEEKGRRC